MPRKKNQRRRSEEKSHFHSAFDLNPGHECKYLSFSQRKYLGFRNQKEFDKKRILVASKNQITIYSQEMATWYEILKETLEPNEEIRYIEFIEDIVPKYLVLIVNDTQKHESFLKIKHILKNQKYLEKKNLVKTSNNSSSNEAQF